MHTPSDDASRTPVLITPAPLLVSDFIEVAREGRAVSLWPGVGERLSRSRAIVDGCLRDGRAHYGINTGFGSLSRQRIAPDQLRELQHNLVRSHAAGVGEALPEDVVRATMVLLIASLSRGLSGVRLTLVERLVGVLNAGITPVVPTVGSVGASGDLAPLAAIARVLLGEGEATVRGGARVRAAEALRGAGIAPLPLEAKEGLALINGTHLMAALGALLIHDAGRLLDGALAAAAMAIDASRGSHSFLDERVHLARMQSGQMEVARRLRGLLRGSTIVESHREDDPRVQDPYCLRCTPQVLGGAWDCLGYVKHVVERELGAVTDNPLVFPDPPRARDQFSAGDVVSAGNFHGMPLAVALDCASIGLAQVAGISERRTFWMLSAFDPESHLPAYLAKGAGLSSGLMIAQYTAAACCNEIITLCTPASVSNIVTSAGIEDYNSFGPRAGMKARRALELARYVVAIELMCAAEGLEYHRPLRSGAGVEKAYGVVRGLVPVLTADRSPTADVEAIAAAVARGEFTPGAGSAMAWS